MYSSYSAVAGTCLQAADVYARLDFVLPHLIVVGDDVLLIVVVDPVRRRIGVGCCGGKWTLHREQFYDDDDDCRQLEDHEVVVSQSQQCISNSPSLSLLCASRHPLQRPHPHYYCCFKRIVYLIDILLNIMEFKLLNDNISNK